jgi:AcrR family transcriptional regulator
MGTTAKHVLPAESPRERVLAVATAQLSRGGAAALNVRDIAERAGCSTMMIYTLFGGKEALLESIYREGFERLGAALAACASHADPIARLRDLARGYRAFGIANRALYAAMFSRPIASPRLRGKDARSGTLSFVTLVDAVRYARDRGSIDARHEARSTADALWAVVHGHVSLEVSGHFHDDPAASEARFASLVDTYLAGLTPPRPERKR